MPQPSRRTFLKTAVAGAAALSLPASVRAADSANEEVRFGLIGCGVRGSAFFERAAMVCDPDQSRLDAAAKSAGVAPAQAVTDFRRILDDRDIDAVVIAAPDHWHAPAAILACEAGKHVYVEKPCSHNFRESQLLVAAARRNNVVVQHGTQQRSRDSPRTPIQMLREGVIGDVLVAKAWNIQRRKDIGHAKPAAVPAGVDYDLWVGPAEMVPFQPNRFHGDWHWWYNFGTGDIGNDGAHEIDYARWGLGVDTLPTQDLRDRRQVLLRRRSAVPRHGDLRLGLSGRRQLRPAPATHLRDAALVEELSVQLRLRRRVLRHQGPDDAQQARQADRRRR